MTGAAETAFALDTERQNFKDWLERNAQRLPDKTALIAIDQGVAFTWRDLEDICNRFARFLADRGIGAGDRVVILSDNVVEAMILFLAVFRRGATACPIDVETSANQIAELLARLEPRLVLWRGGADIAAFAAATGADRVRFDRLPAVDGDPDELFTRLRDVPAHPAVPFVGRPDCESNIGFTSGTSAAPKGVIHHFDSYPKVPEACVVLWRLTASDRLLEYRSFAWASTHTLSLMPAVQAGASVAIARKFSHSRFFNWIRSVRPTIILGIPAVVNMFLNRQVEIDRSILEGVRFMSCSTAPLHEEELRRFEARYGLPLVQHYGMSEGGMLAGNDPAARKIGSVGRPCVYQDMRVVDENGRDLPRGAVGEIQIAGPQIAYGYLMEDRSIVPIRNTPLKTGDLGYFDDDGCLHITGRLKDLIIRGGVNISPLEIDKVLMDHDDIAEAAAVGVPDKVFGEEVIAYVAAKPGRSVALEALIAHCKARLPPTKLPKHLLMVDIIPRNERGKIDRNALARRWADANPSI